VIKAISLLVPTTFGTFGASVPVTDMSDRKRVQLIAPGSDNVELWATLDPTPTDLSTFAKIQAFTGAGFYPPLDLICTGLRAKRVTGTAAGYSMNVGAVELEDTSGAGVSWTFGGDAMAADVVASQPVLQISGARTVDRVTLATDTAIPADATDFAGIALAAHAADGTLLGLVGTVTTSTTSIPDFASGSLEMTSSGLGYVSALPDGAIITFVTTKDNAGVALGVTNFTIHFEP
jgi:hypothetical protein